MNLGSSNITSGNVILIHGGGKYTDQNLKSMPMIWQTIENSWCWSTIDRECERKQKNKELKRKQKESKTANNNNNNRNG